MEIAFMVFGLGFFLLVFLFMTRDHREAYERRIMELREFGFRKSKKTDTDSPPKQ